MNHTDCKYRLRIGKLYINMDQDGLYLHPYNYRNFTNEEAQSIIDEVGDINLLTIIEVREIHRVDERVVNLLEARSLFD